MVLDYYMPGLDGGQVAAEMRPEKSGNPHHFPLGLLLPAAKSLELADGFITKGDPPEALIEKIEQLA